MEIGIVALSSKGQLVIPQRIRKDLNLKVGDRLAIVEDKGTLVLKPMRQVQGSIEEGLADMAVAARRWKEVEQGKAKRMKKSEFLSELARW